MCGRYSLEAGSREIAEAFELAETIAFGPRYNIAPTQAAPVVRLDPESHASTLALMHWGLARRWSEPGRVLINARAESIAQKPSFRKAFRRRRCLVPATGFYEWQKLGRARQPFHVGLRGGGIFAFAGIWDRFLVDSEPREGFVILTTRPNAVTAPIHDRMPVLLERAAAARWLDPGIESFEGVSDLLAPAPDDRLAAWPVSALVNSAARDEPACVRPLAPQASAGEPSLWDEPA